jgi:hypothetical protein
MANSYRNESMARDLARYEVASHHGGSIGERFGSIAATTFMDGKRVKRNERQSCLDRSKH